MKQSPKISVIIPVYNVQDYLPKCIESVINQNYENTEIILVEDCSPDKSGEICDKYAQKDSRIRVIHKKVNEGSGNARKDGVKVATGDWLCFVDSDDWIDSDSFQKLSPLMTDDTDIIVFGMKLCYEDETGNIKKTELLYAESNCADDDKQIGDLLPRLDCDRIFPYMCNKLYRRDFVANSSVEFNTFKIMEDFFYNIEIFYKARCIKTVNYTLYNYRKMPKETLSSAYNKEFFNLSVKRYISEVEFVKNKDAFTEKNNQMLIGVFVKHIISCLVRDCSKNSGLSYKEQKQNSKIYFNNKIVEDAIAVYTPSSFKLKMISFIIKKKYYIAAMLIAELFNTLKKVTG